MEFSIDPLTQVYIKIRQVIIADPFIMQAFKVANIANLADGTQMPIKTAVQNADMPELVIAPQGGRFMIGQTNIGHSFTKRFTIRTATQQMSVNNKFFPAQWALFHAFCRNYREVPRLGLDFVALVKYMDATEAVVGGGTDVGRGTDGWVSLMSLEVTMNFTDKDLGLTKVG